MIWPFPASCLGLDAQEVHFSLEVGVERHTHTQGGVCSVAAGELKVTLGPGSPYMGDSRESVGLLQTQVQQEKGSTGGFSTVHKFSAMIPQSISALNSFKNIGASLLTFLPGYP